MKTNENQNEIYKVNTDKINEAHITKKNYEILYNESISDPEKFWGREGLRLDWFKKYTKVKNVSFKQEDLHIHWYEDGELNVSYNCIERHLPKKAKQVAIIWEANEINESKSITYEELHYEVCKFANVLKNQGVVVGDVVTIYMPMIPEAVYAMLAVAHIGAIHSVVFGGFSPEALADRINDCSSKYLITANVGLRGKTTTPLKQNVDLCLKNEKASTIKKVLVVKRNDTEVEMLQGRDFWYHEEKEKVDSNCKPVSMKAESPLFILYTSGSTGKPKGVLHTTGGYLVYVSMTFEYVFDYHDGDIFWCTADIGWVTGHSYIVYGPLATGATTVIFEGIPNYPTDSRFWEIIDKHNINIFYTAPTAIRALMKEGNDPVNSTSRKSLKLLGSVGEPINPEAWRWYYNVVGSAKIPIVDTWWQTETGGILITPFPYATDLKPGSTTKPFFGIEPILVDDQGNELKGAVGGNLCLKNSWPGQARTIYGDHDRFIKTYFTTFKGYYFTGDGAYRDEDGYYWITGRVDDVLNVSGHRLGTADIESALVSHNQVAEAAVVGFTHDIKGQGIYAFVTLKTGVPQSDEIKILLKEQVRKKIGPIATPDVIHWAINLPKTRSGKIMRRILRKIAEKDFDNFGDISTLADPNVVQELINNI